VEGSFPVGAVVSRHGEVVATGCNHIFATGRDLAGSGLAHAEIDALRKLTTDPHDDLLLTTTLEPCPMCMGAIYVKRVGAVEFLAADPYGGACGLAPLNPLMRRYEPRLAGPDDGPAGRVAQNLVVAWLVSTGHWSATLQAFAEHDPALVHRVRNDLADELSGAAAAGAPFSDIVDLF